VNVGELLTSPAFGGSKTAKHEVKTKSAGTVSLGSKGEEEVRTPRC